MIDGVEHLASSRRVPLWSAVDAYVPAVGIPGVELPAKPATEMAEPATGKQGRKKDAKKIEAEAQQAIEAKAKLGSQKAPVMGLAASAVKSAKAEDLTALSADALRLTSETVAKSTPAATSLNAGGNLIDGLNKAARGDAFGAASAASAVVEKVAPTLAKTGVGAIASAIILGTGDNKLGQQAKALGRSAQKLVAPDASGTLRAKAALDFTINLHGLADLGRTLALAAGNIGRFGLELATRRPALAPVARGVKDAAGAFAATRLGHTLTFLNKWIPLLNVVGVAISGKTAIDVFRSPRSSDTTRALAIASLGTAGLGLWAGFALPGVAFLAIVAASIGLDLMLASARKRDAAKGDMDAQAARWLKDPHEAAADLTAAIDRGGSRLAAKGRDLGAQARGRLQAGDTLPAPDPTRSLTRQ